MKHWFAATAPGDDEELRGFERTIAEIEWLLVALVLLHQVFQDRGSPQALAVYAGLGAFVAFTMGFRYSNFYREWPRWKLVLRTWGMVALITWTLFFTGSLQSPLVSLYILVIVTSALALGKAATLLQTALIAACQLLIGYHDGFTAALSLDAVADVAITIAPLVLVAYVTTMLAADIRTALRRIRQLSEIDALTGIYNARAFGTQYQQAFSQAQRYERPLGIVMIDSDNLKAINDNFGHEAGNQLLRATVACIQATIRSADIVARVGGDEFIVLLPETTGDGAAELGERIRRRIEETVLDMGGQATRTTVSIGIAAFPEHSEDAQELLTGADRALYASKKGGRNRVSLFAA